jgi:hypothetical protein
MPEQRTTPRANSAAGFLIRRSFARCVQSIFAFGAALLARSEWRHENYQSLGRALQSNHRNDLRQFSELVRHLCREVWRNSPS